MRGGGGGRGGGAQVQPGALSPLPGIARPITAPSPSHTHTDQAGLTPVAGRRKHQGFSHRGAGGVPGFVLAEGQEGVGARAGPGTGAQGPPARSVRAGGEATRGDGPRVSRGRAVRAAARPPCLQCPECTVSFMNLKYKQNKITLFSGNSRSVGEWLDHICFY